MAVEDAPSYADLQRENARLQRELAEARQHESEARDREAEGLARETATREILRVIASSPTDLQAVLHAVGERAARLCDGAGVFVYRVEANRLLRVAGFGSLAHAETNVEHPLDRTSATGQAVLDRQTIHLHDVAAAPKARHRFGRELQQQFGFRTVMATPMVREGAVVGAISVLRMEVRPFTVQQIKLPESFADQAVIAIENVRLFQDIEDKSRQLEAASQHKSEFLANMSHELRTPLNAIIGYAELLGEEAEDLGQDAFLPDLKKIHTAGQHLLGLVNDILDLSKVEAGKMELELSTFALPEALDNGLTMIEERAGRHAIALGLAVDPEVGLVEADERKVKQVVFNLLSNAVKFTPDRGRVELSARLVDAMVQVAVRDSGVGIAPEDQEHIFEEFRQVGTGTTKAEGTGLGLPLAKRFVELHGGSMWVESQVGAGSVFTFTLPVKRSTVARADAGPGAPPAT